jgi:hypothetical protein
VLRRIFRLKRGEVTGLRKLHKQDLHNLCFSPAVISMTKLRRVRCVIHVAHIEEMSNAYRILTESSEGKTLLRRSKHRWEDNIKLDLKKIAGVCGLD